MRKDVGRGEKECRRSEEESKEGSEGSELEYRS